MNDIGPEVPEVTDLVELCAITGTYWQVAFILIDGHVLSLLSVEKQTNLVLIVYCIILAQHCPTIVEHTIMN